MRFLLSLLCLAVLAPAAAAAEMQLSKYPRVYKGGEGMVVTVVSLKGEKKQALVEITGIDTELDGIVLLTEEINAGKGTALTTTLHGETVWLLRSDETWYGWKRMEVYLPETPTKSTDIHYDEKASKQAKPESLAKRHQSQLKDGTIGKLQKFNRADREKAQNKYYADEIKSTEEACGYKIPADIDWKSVTDELLKEISIHGYCSPPLSALRSICGKSAADKANVKKRVKKIACKFGAAMKITLGDDGTISWVTHKDSANQDDFAQNNLVNALH